MWRHRWYLTQELMPLCLLSKAICPKEKERMTLKLFVISSRHIDDEWLRQSPIFPIVTDDTALDLLGDRNFRNVLIFQRIEIQDGKAYSFFYLPTFRKRGSSIEDCERCC